MLLLDAAAGGDDLLARARGHLHTAYGECLADLAVGEHLDRALAALDHARRGERVARDLRPGRHFREVLETDDLRLHAERVREPALRQTARERHLAALEMRSEEQ